MYYTCALGKETDVYQAPDLQKEYKDFVVYHSELLPNGLFKECLDCKVSTNGILINEETNKAELVKLCNIWRKED